MWDNTYVSGEDWYQPDWVSINSTSNSFSILLDQVHSSGAQQIKFQATLVRMKLIFLIYLQINEMSWFKALNLIIIPYLLIKCLVWLLWETKL